jgi:hypothetical protein
MKSTVFANIASTKSAMSNKNKTKKSTRNMSIVSTMSAKEANIKRPKISSRIMLQNVPTAYVLI